MQALLQLPVEKCFVVAFALLLCTTYRIYVVQLDCYGNFIIIHMSSSIANKTIGYSYLAEQKVGDG